MYYETFNNSCKRTAHQYKQHGADVSLAGRATIT